MATATQQPPSAAALVPGEYTCECGNVLRVFGGGRHRIFFGMETSRRDDPVMNRACPACGRRLPGKGRPYGPTGVPDDGAQRS